MLPSPTLPATWLKGHRLGTPAEIAAAATWRQVTVWRYGRRDTVEITVIDSICYGAFGNTQGRTVLVREPGSEKVLAIFTTDTTRGTETVVARYADRWPIEVAIAGGKQTARHRPGPQPAAARGAAHRATELLRLQPRRHLVHAARLPPRGPHRPPRRSALVLPQGRHRLRRHARQAPQNPCRSTNYGR